MSDTPFTDGYFESMDRSHEDFCRLVEEREKRLGPPPRQLKYLEVQEMDDLLHQALSALRKVSGQWCNFESTCRDCETNGAALQIVGGKDAMEVYFYVQGSSPLTSEDLPHCEENMDQIAAESIKQNVCSAFYHYADSLNAMEERKKDFWELILSVSELTSTRDRFEMMALNYEIFSPGFTVPPYQLLESMKKGTLEHYRKSGKKGANSRHAKVQKQYSAAEDLARELWQSPSHKDKLHHQMARFLIEDYVTDSGEVPFSNLSISSLKDRLKEYLKNTGQIEKIFNYTPPHRG